MVIKINDNKFKVKVARTPKETSTGMMGKTFDSTFNGMLFDMGEGRHCFWMKNCITSLDIIFIDNGEITKIHHNCPPCKTKDCKNYCGTGELVLELEGGTCEELDITEGDVVYLL
jgi:uncharacterized membrane protein (UPF0127 family)